MFHIVVQVILPFSKEKKMENVMRNYPIFIRLVEFKLGDGHCIDCIVCRISRMFWLLCSMQIRLAGTLELLGWLSLLFWELTWMLGFGRVIRLYLFFQVPLVVLSSPSMFPILPIGDFFWRSKLHGKVRAFVWDMSLGRLYTNEM